MTFNEMPQVSITMAVQGEGDDEVMVLQLSFGTIFGMSSALTPEEAGVIGNHLVEFSKRKPILNPFKGSNRIKLQMPNGG